jgi:hypothetical protein
MVRRASEVRSAVDRLPKSEAPFDVAIVVSVDGDEAAKDEEVGNRATEARPESVPGSRLGIGTGVPQKPVGRVSPEDGYEYKESNEDDQTNSETPFHGVTPDLSLSPCRSRKHFVTRMNRQLRCLVTPGIKRSITREGSTVVDTDTPGSVLRSPVRGSGGGETTRQAAPTTAMIK